MPIKKINAGTDQNGIALVLCMVLATVFAAISIYISEKEQQQFKLFQGLQEKIELEHQVHSLLQKIHYSTLTNQKFEWQGNEVELNGHSEIISLANPLSKSKPITLTIQDAAGLISASSPDTNMLVTLINNLSEQSNLGHLIMDAWYDWEDKDNLSRLNGQEQGLFKGNEYTPRNDKIQMVAELQLIANMEGDLYKKLRNHLIFFIDQQFSVKAASNELRKLLGLTELSPEQRLNEFTRVRNGLSVEQKQSFMMTVDMQGEFSRIHRRFVLTYRPDEIRLVSIREFGD